MQRYELFLKPPNISLIIYRHLMSTSCRHRNEIPMFKLRITGYYDGEEQYRVLCSRSYAIKMIAAILKRQSVPALLHEESV